MTGGSGPQPRTPHPDDMPRGALVTGAARRIGRAIALDLARHGWAVAVHYRGSAEAAAEVVREIESGGGRAVALAADLAALLGGRDIGRGGDADLRLHVEALAGGSALGVDPARDIARRASAGGRSSRRTSGSW